MIEDVTPPLAFPSQPRGMDGLPDEAAVPGMTLRDWFAGQALAGICATLDGFDVKDFGDGARGGRFVVSAAYNLADAMLAIRAPE